MFEVQWCIQGKEPDSKPFAFFSFNEAREFLMREIYWALGDSDSETSNSQNELDAIEKLDLLQKDDNPRTIAIELAGVIYWILESKVPTDIYAV